MAEVPITVATLDSQSVEVAISLQATVLDLKRVVEERLEVPVARQRLLFRARLMEDLQTLAACGVHRNARVSLVANAVREAAEEADAGDPFLDFLRVISASPAALISRRPRRPPRRELTEGERVEGMRQNMLTLQSLLDMRSRGDCTTAFDLSRRSLAKGMWVDVKDTVDQWLEAQIVDVRSTPAGTMVFVHYNGWPSRWDEWIDVRSPRIQPLRARTFQSISAPMHCPYPVVAPDPPEALQTPVNDLPDTALHTAKYLTQARSMMERYYRLHTILKHESAAAPAAPHYAHFSPEERKLGGRDFSDAAAGSEGAHDPRSIEDAIEEPASGLTTEQEFSLLSGQIAPILDRFGRLLCDLGVTISKDLNQQMGERGDFPAATTLPTPAELYSMSGGQFGPEAGTQVALFAIQGRRDHRDG